MISPKPGDAVDFTLTFSGIVTKVRGAYLEVRTKRGLHTIKASQVARVIDPEPDEAEVVRVVRCSGCGRVPGAQCRHKQTDKLLKHPHKERIETYIKVTGWKPND